MKNDEHIMSYEEARVVLMAMAKCETDPVKQKALTKGCMALMYRTPRKPIVNEYDERCCWMCGKPISEEPVCPHCGARIKYE